ncbi:hypothetical protein DQ04_07391010 [Trypanosoma grayi]|uniref:hypothetical protein n=1 Tax=Trypanosoma grayi TaxID=71804 RepID=UPI0004F413EC|nr:hypothetical protein DQ04_07391010 [Trypanosoma grayi]KEG08352.1 hypothetical protein DQ04_07391010 [Trypanosoma grayi]
MPGQRKVQVDPDLLVTSVFDTFPEQQDNVVRVFDEEGCLTTREIGVKRFQFARLSIFHTLRSLPWSILITYSILVYLAILFVCSVVYFTWAHACGASEGVTWAAALYFTVVSLAANGGYVGEQMDTMISPIHVCFVGRTIIVMVLSYTNIIFVGLVAALVVGKAEYSGKLGQRVVFSDFCSLTVVPGRRDHCWRLTFRMANSMGQKPVAHGRLRVFIISAELLQDYRRRRKEMMKEYYGKLLERQPTRGSGGGDTLRGRSQALMSLTADRLTADRLREQQQQQEGSKTLTSSFALQMDPPIDPAVSTRLRRQQEHRRRPSGGKLRRRRPRQAGGQETADDDEATHKKKSSLISLTTAVNVADPGQKEGAASSQTAGTESSNVQQQQPQQEQEQEQEEGGQPQSRTRPGVPQRSTSAAGDDSSNSSESNPSVKTHPSDGSREAGGGEADGTDEADDFERVRICVEEVRWCCSEERYLEARQGQLSLWFPVSITHTIDRQSPLYRYMEREKPGSPTLGSSRSTAGTSTAKAAAAAAAATAAGGGGGGRGAAASTSPRSFQIVATFDATDMDSGATITAKRTYTVTDIVAHYRFSNKLVRMRPGSSEVLLDYHYFNEMLPVTAVESSTTDSDAPYDNV